MSDEQKHIDCLELIKDLLVFDSADDFYFLQILQRKKENLNLGSNSRVIKNYYIRSFEQLSERYEEIKLLCNLFNARASLRINKRSFEKTAFQMLQSIANTMQNREYSHLHNSYQKACGKNNNAKIKKWIIDVDNDAVAWTQEIVSIINCCQPLGDKLLKKLPTKNGIHLITTPFNVSEFYQKINEECEKRNINKINVDIHKDNPINLYIP